MCRLRCDWLIGLTLALCAGIAVAQGFPGQLPGNNPPARGNPPGGEPASPPAQPAAAAPPAPNSASDPCAATVAGVPAGSREAQIETLRKRIAESADLAKLVIFRTPQEAEAVQHCFETRLERLRADLPRSRELVAIADDIETFQHNWGGKIDAFLGAQAMSGVSAADWWTNADEAFASLADLAVRVPQGLGPLQAERAQEIEPLERELSTFANEIATLKANQAGVTTREDREKWLWILSWRANNAARAFDELELADLRRARPGGAPSDLQSIETARAAIAEFQPELNGYLAQRAEFARSRRDGALQNWFTENDPAAVAKILYLLHFAAHGDEQRLLAEHARDRAARAEPIRERAALIPPGQEGLEARTALARQWAQVTADLDRELATLLDESKRTYDELRRDVRAKGLSLPLHSN